MYICSPRLAAVTIELKKLAADSSTVDAVSKEIETVANQMASGKLPPQKVRLLSQHLSALTKRLVMLTTLAVGLSVTNPAQGQDTNKSKDTTVQSEQDPVKEVSLQKIRELSRFLTSKGHKKTDTLGDCWSDMKQWVENNVTHMHSTSDSLGTEPASELKDTLIKANISPKTPVLDAMPYVFLYFHKVSQTSCSGTGMGNDAGTGSCWVN